MQHTTRDDLTAAIKASGRWPNLTTGAVCMNLPFVGKVATVRVYAGTGTDASDLYVELNHLAHDRDSKAQTILKALDRLDALYSVKPGGVRVTRRRVRKFIARLQRLPKR